MIVDFRLLNEFLEALRAQFLETTVKRPIAESLRAIVSETRALFEKRFFNIVKGTEHHASRADKWLNKRDAYAKQRRDPNIDPMTQEKLKRRQIKADYLSALHTVRAASYGRARDN